MNPNEDGPWAFGRLRRPWLATPLHCCRPRLRRPAIRLGERKSLRHTGDLADLPQLNAVELALGIAEGCNLPFARAIGGIISERCALA